ncbi:MAG: polysaccharide biosynthesis tyrosine autokinase [Deltaproteobacteria bacterium]|nr:polysaccharide biosynthesis tyrosine autokinase [Deltaproteobacteria bacterium]
MLSKIAPSNRSETSLRDIYLIVCRQRWKIALFFLAVMVVTTLVTFLSPKIYRSEAQLMVRLGRESVTLDPTASTGQVVSIGQSRENEIKTELQILQSRALAEQVVDAIGYQAILEGQLPSSSVGQASAASSEDVALERDKAVRSLTQGLELENKENSNIIAVAYEAKSPKLAQAVVAKFVDLFRDHHIRAHRTYGSDEFFNQQTEQLRVQLAESENALKELKNQSGIASVTEQRTILLNRIGDLQRQLEGTEAALAASRSRVRAMQKTLASAPSTLVRSRIAGYSGNPLDFLQQRLLELQIQEKELRATMTEKNRLVKDVRQQIAEVQALIDKEGATHAKVTNLALLAEQAMVSELQAKAKVLKQELVQAQSELAGINEAEVKIARLEREIEIQRNNFRNYADKFSQAKIDRALEMEKISNISVVQPASSPVKPVRPRKGLNLALGFFVGAFGGVGLGFLSEYMDHSFRTPDEVTRKLQLPVLAAIPRFEGQKAKGYLVAGVPLLLPRVAPVWDMAEEMTERCGLLPANMLCDKTAADTAQLLAVTSCYSGEGVSTFAANLAINLVNQTGSRVLLVDANLAQPSIHQVFKVSQAPGLADLLAQASGLSNSIQPSNINNLDILTAGQGQVNLARFFESRQFVDLLDLWKREYRFIIIDTPPFQEAATVTRLSRLADGVVLVVESERTRWEVVQQAQAALEKAQAHVLGVVLNKRQFHIPGWLYRTL